MEKEKEEKKRIADKLESEKEMIERKVMNFKKHPDAREKEFLSPVVKSKTFKFENSFENISDNHQDEKSFRLDTKNINKKIIIYDISSDIENMSRK